MINRRRADPLKAKQIEAARRSAGKAAGLFITDRCPVGCSHCSVDSKPDSATVTDFPLFEEVLAGICASERIEIVAITGGEAFVERRALKLASETLFLHKKRIVIFTSGVWAKERIPEWISDTLEKVETVFLSTDGFHNAKIDDSTFVRAAQTCASAGCWIIVQVLDIDEMVEKASRLLRQAFGSNFDEQSEIVKSKPLPYGRGANHFSFVRQAAGKSFGACHLLGSPLIRYDGVVSACCNENVVTGRGPSRLSKSCISKVQVIEAMNDFSNDVLLGLMREVGLGALTCHNKYRNMQEKKYLSICDICWEMQSEATDDFANHDALLVALNTLSKTG